MSPRDRFIWRRDRTQPKLHIDQTKLMATLWREFPGASITVDTGGLDTRPQEEIDLARLRQGTQKRRKRG